MSAGAQMLTGGIQLLLLAAFAGEFSGFRLHDVSGRAWFALIYLIIAGSLIGATDYLIGFPYGCTEQTMSRFLPDLLVERVLKLHGMSDVKRQEELPRMVRAGLNRLYRFQHSESGGWGWWEHDSDDAWMTAYVLYGLATAKRLIREAWARSLDVALDAERDAQRLCGLSPDYKEGVAAFKDKRPTRFTGARP